MALRCRLLVLVAGVASTLSVNALELPLSARMEASMAWAENISHTSAQTDRKSAARYDFTGSVSTLHEWPNGFVSIAEIAGTAQSVRNYSKANSVTVGPHLTVRRKFGLGAFAPVLEGGLGLAYRDARVFADDGWTSSASLRVSQRITNAWRFAATGDWSQHDGKNATFDTSQHRLFAQVSWDPVPRLQLSYGVGRLWGAVTANAAGAVWSRALSGALGPKVFEYYNQVPWQTTNIYGPRWVTYRVDAFANFQWLELSPALGPNTSLPLRVERMNTINLIGIRYPQEIWSLSLLHRF